MTGGGDHAPGDDRNVFCYAGKEHPELEDHESLLFMYVGNTARLDKDVHRVVRMPLPVNISGTGKTSGSAKP